MSEPEFVSFSVDATHIDRLGRELVARQDTALAELIKNAYDADATELLVTFHATDGPRPARIEIEDNGSGMTRDEIVRGFMRISTWEKVEHPQSPVLRRLRAGRKGIGRFAAQRLARKLTVITKSRLGSTDTALRLEIDWDDYVAKRDIQDVSVPLRVEATASYGTRLILDDLRDLWTEDDVKEVSDSLAPLIQPQIETNESQTEANSFTFAFVGPTGKTYTPTDAFRALSKQAIATIKGSVDENGIPIVSVLSQRIPGASGDTRLQDEPKGALRGVTLRAFYFIQNKEWLPDRSDERKTVRESLRRYGGIRVYRNGFRVMPYGERSDDWAQLDAEYRKRGALLAPIGNQNFIGIVDIADPDGTLFQETSSREGLIENVAFRELREFVFGTCYEAVRKISEVRAEQATRQGKAAATDIEDQVSEFAARLNLFQQATTEAEKTDIARSMVAIGRGIEKSVTVLKQTRIDEINMLRVLSTLGMTVAEFVHEVRGTITLAAGDLSDLLNATFMEPTKSRLNRLKVNLGMLSRYTDYFSAVVSSNESLSVAPVSVDRVFRTFQKFAVAIVSPKQIELNMVVDGYGVNSKPMHEAEWLSILTNFLSNSVKAIALANPKHPSIQIRAFKSSSDVVIRFSDNGIGIPVDKWKKVFDAFYSTTRPDLPRSRGNADSATGMGLGLKIVRDIAESNGGTVAVVQAQDGFTTCFEVRVPGGWLRI